MKNILDKLIESQLRIFANSYKNTSHELFYDEDNNRLLHPGEFGSWRENLLRDLLVNFLPESFGVSQGFVINSDGDISNQCDIIIYSRPHTPVFRTHGYQRFFPVESVVAVIEVKSIVNKKQMRDALQKLVKVKEVRRKKKSSVIYQKPNTGNYNPETFVRDQIGTFIFAERINLKKKVIVDLIKESTLNKNSSLRVNHIVSIDDYCTTYEGKEESRGWMYPIWVNGEELPLRFDFPNKLDENPHLKLFIRYLLLIISDVTILTPELTHYFGGIKGLDNILEREL